MGEALRYNKTLTVLKVNGNLLGADTGQAFAEGVRVSSVPLIVCEDGEFCYEKTHR